MKEDMLKHGQEEASNSNENKDSCIRNRKNKSKLGSTESSNK